MIFCVFRLQAKLVTTYSVLRELFYLATPSSVMPVFSWFFKLQASSYPKAEFCTVYFDVYSFLRVILILLRSSFPVHLWVLHPRDSG